MGFQAEGTRGRHLLEGSSEIKIYGKYYHVKAQIHCINSLSAHADQSELLDWLSEIDEKPEEVFIVHGEPNASDAFRLKLKDHFGWHSVLPNLYDIQQL